MQIVSSLSPDKLISSIQKNCVLDTLSGVEVIAENVTVGKFDGNKFRLYRQPGHKNNPFRPYFFGEVVKTEAGSEIRGSFKVLPSTKVAMGLWLSTVGAILCGMTYAMVVRLWRPELQEGLLALTVALGMCVFFFLFIRNGHRDGAEAKAYLTDLLNGCAEGASLRQK
jgi:hypothetical protein